MSRPRPKFWEVAWLCWLSLIIILSLAPRFTLPEVTPDLDKMHLFAYFILSIIPLYQFHALSQRGKYLLLGFNFLLGVLMELLQSFIPGRTCDSHDVLSNSLGIVAALLIWRTVVFFRCKTVGKPRM